MNATCHSSCFSARLLLSTGFSWAVNAAEAVLFVMTRHPMAKSTRLRTFAVEAMGGGVFIGAAVGGPLFGRIADSHGRRYALLLAKTLSMVGLLLCAMARKDYEVINARILAGIGLGGELPVTLSLVYEFTPIPMRSRGVTVLQAFTGVGGVLGVFLAFVVVPQFGWRIAYLVVSAGIFFVGVLCVRLPESPEWLSSVDRSQLIDKEIPKTSARNYEKTAKMAITSSVLDKPVDVLVLWGLWLAMELSSYALGVYIPLLIGLWGFNMLSGWETMTLLHLSNALGAVLVPIVLEKHGLKKILVVSTTSAAVVAVTLSYAPWYGPIVAVLTCLETALLAASWTCVLIHTLRRFTTETRGRGVGFAFGFSRLGAIGGSWLYSRMFNNWKLSVSGITWIFAGLLVSVALEVITCSSVEEVGNGKVDEKKK